jgi:hypothetical protein
VALRENLAEWSKQPFESSAHMQEAIRDQQYSRIPEYRRAVEAKICLSSSTGTRTAVHASVEREDSEVGAGLGNSGTEAEQNRRATERDVERQMYESQGPMSVSPSARIRIATENADPNSGYGFQQSEGQ